MAFWDGKNIIHFEDKPYGDDYPGWTLVDCGCCAGMQWGGDHPAECPRCNGGFLVRHEASKRLALYPGGPFAGRA